MKRLCVLILALALVAVMVAPALATWTRVATMGNQGQFIQDDYGIWTWTSTVNNYPRHLIIDHSIDAGSGNLPGAPMGTFGGTQVGMIIPFLGHSVLGAFINNYIDAWALAPNAAAQNIDLFYGYRGTNFDLGARIDYNNTSSEFGGKVGASAIGLNVGVGFNLSGNMLEGNVMYRALSWNNEEQFPVVQPWDPLTEKDAGNEMGFNARYLIAYNSMVTLVPAFAYRAQKVSEKLSTAAPGVGDGSEFKTTAYDLGIGCNTVPLQGTEFLTSIGVRSVNNKFTDQDTTTATDYDETDSHFPYISFGSEIQVKNWLQFRFGAEKTWDGFNSKSTVAGVPEDKFHSASFDYHVGAGIMVGDLQWDVEVNPNWFNAGPYLLSGENAGDMFLNISIKYDYR
jgi:hypothetical protein